MCFVGHCKSATDFAGYVLEVDRHLMDMRSQKRAHNYIMTLAVAYDDAVDPLTMARVVADFGDETGKES